MVRVDFASSAHLTRAVAEARRAIAAHGVIALPTESSYGLAVPPDDALGLERVYSLKQRSPDKRLPVVGASMAQLERLVHVPEAWRRPLEDAWPAPLTVVLARKGGAGAAAGGTTLAVRVPAHDLLRALLAEVGPLTATSANPSGTAPLTDPSAVAAALPGLALLLDGGRAPGASPSTLLDHTCDPPRLLRRGPWEPPAAWRAGP
jgi:L-threonylcarbamoyladenylate synthase